MTVATPRRPSSSLLPGGASRPVTTELPLDHTRCTEDELRAAYATLSARTRERFSFAAACRNPLLGRCLRNLAEARRKAQA